MRMKRLPSQNGGIEAREVRRSLMVSDDNDKDNDPFSVIEAVPPCLTAADAVAIARDRYGLNVEARPMVSERDQNFLLRTPDGRQLVLKIANALEDPLVTDFQIRALQHIESKKDASIAAPTIVETKDGRSDAVVEHGNARHVTRVVSYLPGRPLADVPLTPALCRDLGACLARLDRALADFSHPGADQSLLWDIKRATRIRELLPHVKDPDARGLLQATLDEFEKLALPGFATLRRQVIHNDANPGNVLVAPDGRRIAGLIDFGDMLGSPLIVDVAVAAAYLRVLQGNPLTLITELIAGFHSVTALTRPETDVLHELIKTRLATTVAILAWRESLRDKDDAYLRDASAAERTALPFLRLMAEIPRANAQQIYSQVCASIANEKPVT